LSKHNHKKADTEHRGKATHIRHLDSVEMMYQLHASAALTPM